MKVASRSLLTFILLLASIGCAKHKSPYQQGRAAAIEDLARGRISVESYGLPSPGVSHALATKYGVHTRVVGDCVVTEEVTEHAKGFNDVMWPEIERRHGKDLIRRILENLDEEMRKKPK